MEHKNHDAAHQGKGVFKLASNQKNRDDTFTCEVALLNIERTRFLPPNISHENNLNADM